MGLHAKNMTAIFQVAARLSCAKCPEFNALLDSSRTAALTNTENKQLIENVSLFEKYFGRAEKIKTVGCTSN
jgi:hypothetical protein